MTGFSQALLGKTVKFFIAVVLVIFLAQPVFATGGIVLKASSFEGAKGGQIRVEIEAENLAGTEGGQFTLKFDPAVVRPAMLEPGSLVTAAEGSLNMANLEYANDALIFMWVTAAADTKDQGQICTIVFDLIEEGVTDLTFEEIVIAPEGLKSAKPVAGKVTVAGQHVAGQNGVATGSEKSDDLASQASGEEDPEAGADKKALPGENGSRHLKGYILPLAILLLILVVGLFVRAKGGKKRKAKH